MNDLELLECCQSVLDFLNDETEVSNFRECETMIRMDKVLSKNNFNTGGGMVPFMRWLSKEYNFEGPDKCDDLREYFSDGYKFTEDPAKTFLRLVIGEIRDKRLNEILKK